jgi:hypothetical protein
MMKIALLAASAFQVCIADLRLASQPRANRRRNEVTEKDQYKVIYQSRRRYTKFNTSRALYFEPSAFGYDGLENQRQKAYDNFLRSNIDNEQDRRNFDTEDGKDHLPFRTYEGANTDKPIQNLHVETTIPDGSPGPHLDLTPGVPMLVPLRWNNPHASELEVNIWVKGAANKWYVAPVRKPTCSGEGYQDNAFSFTIPTNFHDSLKAKIPGYTTCKTRGDCIVQVYAHSVESRTYAIGIPAVISGTTNVGATAQEAGILPACQDVGTDLSSLRLICRPSNDPNADITPNELKVYQARLVSDVYNHAYQNSDYSPYSGQQCNEISKNLQASCVLKMLPANRGELGQHALATYNRDGFHFQRELDRKAKHLYKKYESMANSLIKLLETGDKTNATFKAAASHNWNFTYWAKGHCKGGHRRHNHDVKSLQQCLDYCAAEEECERVSYDPINPHSRKSCLRWFNAPGDCEKSEMNMGWCPAMVDGRSRWGPYCNYTTYAKVELKGDTSLLSQSTETCFRCAEVGSTVYKRHETTTYIPSFKINDAAKAEALNVLMEGSEMYSNLISSDGHVNIYVATLNDLREEFNKAINLHNITYLGPMIKTTMTTKADPEGYKRKEITETGEDYAAFYTNGWWNDLPSDPIFFHGEHLAVNVACCTPQAVCNMSSNAPATWYEAKKLCEAQGKTLPRIKSEAQNKALLNEIRGKTQTHHGVWLDLTDSAKEGEWKWGDGTLLPAKGGTGWNRFGGNEPNDYQAGRRRRDRGTYAAREAYKVQGLPPWKFQPATWSGYKNISAITDTATGAAARAVKMSTLSTLSAPFPITGGFALPEIALDGGVEDMEDMDAQMVDANCEDPVQSDDETECKPPTTKLFADSDSLSLEAETLNLTVLNLTTTTTTPIGGTTTCHCPRQTCNFRRMEVDDSDFGFVGAAVAYSSAGLAVILSCIIAMA